MADALMFAAAAWLLTYVVHSSLMLGAAALVARRVATAAEAAWRIALIGAPVTAAVQVAGAWARMPSLPFPIAAPARLPDAPSRAMPLLLALWAAVAAVRVAMLMRRRRSLAQLLARRVPIADDAIDARVHALSGGGRIRVSLCDGIRTPMVVGRDEVCLPGRALAELTPDELDAVLAHEVAHLARRDDLWLSCAALIERVLFVQPLNAVAVRRLRALAECSCDDWALRRIESPVALASALARVAGWLVGTPSPAPALGMASRESLALARVRRILDPGVERLARSWRRRDAASAALALMLVVFGVPGFTPQGVRYTVSAHDDAGPFTVTLERGRVVDMTIDGARVDPSRLERRGRHLRVRDARDRVALDLTLTAHNGFRWRSRPARGAASHP